jgi:hypothetical protein
MKLEFNGLNGLLHTALTYLCQDDCVIPGGPALPEGTPVRLELVYPDGDEPLVVSGNSLGLDPGGRGLRLEIHDPAALHQVIMLMAHLHLGPYVARKLLSRFSMVDQPAAGQPQVAAPMAHALPVTELPQLTTETIEPAVDEGTRLPSVSDELKVKDPLPPPVVRPPRLRPPVIRPPRVRPPAVATELPQFGREEPESELSRTAIAIDPKLIADLDDLDDDY